MCLDRSPADKQFCNTIFCLTKTFLDNQAPHPPSLLGDAPAGYSPGMGRGPRGTYGEVENLLQIIILVASASNGSRVVVLAVQFQYGVMPKLR